MGPGKRSRFLAPVALVGAIVATILVITSAVHHSHGSSAPLIGPTSSAHPTTRRRSKASSHTTTLPTSSSASSYTVRSGDTLSAIAARTGVPLATLESLNPSANPSALHAGQRLKLR